MSSKRLASNKNQVQKGYKKTAIGLIPEDWEVKDISAVCLLQRGFDITESTRKFGNVPVYSSSGLAYFHNQAKVNPPGVVTGRKGILGKVFYIEEPFWPHDTTLWVKDFKGNDAKYISFFLTYFNLERFDASTSVPTLNRNNLATISIPVPPLPEQKAIAQTLSDVDVLIDALDKLIAKKRNIKTATMQQLLTGKTRLPGFGEGKGYKKTEVGIIPEDWEVDNLGKFITEFRGGAPLKPSDFTKGGVKVLPKGAVVRGGFLKINDKDLQFCSKQYANHYGKNKINNTYIVVVLRDLVPSGPSIGLIVKIKKPEIYILAQGVYGFKTQGIIDEYLIQYSNSFPYRRLMNEIMVGSTQVHITNTAFKAIKLPFPPIPEQQAIAQVLSDIDSEITALEKRRAKTQAIKQGMMQELLTGRTRLKFEHPDDPITKNSNG